MQHEKSTTRKKVQHEKRIRLKKCNIEKVQPEKSATAKKCNMNRVQHEATRKKIKLKKSAT